MCGIFITKKILSLSDLVRTYHKSYDNFLKRGDDSFGYLGVSKKGFVSFKSLDIYDFLTEYEDLMSQGKLDNIHTHIFHNRWASIGGVKLGLAHPVEEKNWIVMHNGTVKGGNICGTDSDTEAIARFVLDSEGLKDYYFKSSGVVVAYNKSTGEVMLHKDKERSLFYNNNLKMWSSEPVLDEGWNAVDNQKWDLLDNFKLLEVDKEITLLTNKKSNYCDCCSGLSSNSVRIKGVDYCYSCLSKNDFILKDIAKSKVTYYGGYRV